MIISKTRFKQYVRCPRLVAFDLLERIKNGKNVQEEINDIYLEEDRERMATLFESIQSESGMPSDEDNEDEDVSSEELHRLLMPQYQMIETLSANKAKMLFGGNVHFSEQTRLQKHADASFGHHALVAYFDGFQEDEQTVRIIETKATTSRKFRDLCYKIDKEVFEILEDIGNNVLVLKDIPDDPKHRAPFLKQRQKLFEYTHEVGKHIFDIAFQKYVYDHWSFRSVKPTKYYLAILNHEYVYDGKTSDDGTPIYDANAIIKYVDVTELADEWQITIESMLHRVASYIKESDTSEDDLGPQCRYNKQHEQCRFFAKCLDDKEVPDIDSVFVYVGGQHKFKNKITGEELSRFDLINQRRSHASDLTTDWLKPKQVIQHDAIINDTPFINTKLIRQAIKQIKYPRYYLDFESLNPPLPQYVGERPFTQSVFQFSIHIQQDKNDNITKDNNYYFLSDPRKGDERKQLVEAMIKLIPNDGKGSVIVYNASFEMTRIKEMATLFPQYRTALESINERMFDLMNLVKGSKMFLAGLGISEEHTDTFMYYHRDLQRSFSIKKVLPIFAPELNYQNLDSVKQGTEAQIAFMKLKDMTGEAFDRLYQDMLDYCKLDTWAMVAILLKLEMLR